MTTSNCRVCHSNFFANPLLQYKNMPKAAQYLPDHNTLDLDTGVALELCQCSGCGLVQLSNDPVPYYREVIRATAVSEEMTSFRAKQFSDILQKHGLKNRKVIEIGCGRGEYLSIMESLNWEVYGLEFSQDAVSHCLGNGLKVEAGFIETGLEKLTNGPFDLFLILNFFEHLPDPNKTLQGISNNIHNGALGIIEVPNFDMILQNNLFSEFIGDHLLYFTKETLSNTLNSNGFEVVECREIWHDYIISATVKKRERLNLALFNQHQNRLTQEINNHLNQFSGQTVAIWGAGHQALAFICLSNITKKIKYVVDSAPFKQGKFTPASHIPIVSPDNLDKDPAAAVIVMAASYSDEVARIIREKYDKTIDVTILRDSGLESIK